MENDAAPVDPLRTLRRLWRHELPPEPPRRGPKARVDLDRVVTRAVRRADAAGLSGLSVRTLAADLGLSRMALYGYVGDRTELVDLMTEHVGTELLAELNAPIEPGWENALRRVADAELAACRRHRWLLEVAHQRPGLGPVGIQIYERELAVVDGLGLTDLEMDQVRWQVINFVRGIARDEAAAQALLAESGQTDLQWWQQRAAFLARFVTQERFPVAVRVGAAAGAAQQSAYDPTSGYAFGLDRLLAGFAELIKDRADH